MKRSAWVGLLVVEPVLGQSPRLMSIGGQLFEPDNTAVVSAAVNFKIEILDAAQTCVLYSESHLNEDLSTTLGRFNLMLGNGSTRANYLDGSGLLDIQVFMSPGVTPVANCAHSTVALNPGDPRQIRISYDLGAGYVALAPTVPLVSSAYAMMADTLQGKQAADFIQVADNGSTVLNQVNQEFVFSATNWPKLKALLDGSSNQYLSTTPSAPLDLNGQRVSNLADPATAQDAVTKHYADTMMLGSPVDISSVGPMMGNNSVLRWDATANKWTAAVLDTTPTGAAGGDLAGTYPNPTIKNDAVTSRAVASSGGGVNRLLITDPTTGAAIGFGVCSINEVYAWTATGWACTAVAALVPVTKVAGKTGDVTLNAADIVGLGTAALYDYGTGAGQLPRLDVSARLPAIDASLLLNVNATKLSNRTVSLNPPTGGQVLGWNVLNTQWEPVTAATGSVQSINSGVGLLGGPITTSGTLSVDVGTSASKILQLNASAQIPAVDGSLLGNVNAVKLQTRAVAATAPTTGQVLGWNASLNQWEPTLGTAGSLTYLQTANGILGGPITSTGTISIDTGTTANKILQLNGAAQIAAVDGSLLFNVNASSLATRAVAGTAPGFGQVLGWNVTSTQWEPVTASTGSVQNVSAGVGLLGGPITQNGTLSVDVGTAAHKILQLNGTAQIPAVDGSLITGVNAVSLQTRSVAATAPTAGQVLAWNTSLSQWEPTLATAGSVTYIQTANGILGGPIASTGTISIDTGTIANKILQLNGAAQIPAVDASLLFDVNAAKIATRTVSGTAPTVGQVLGWNVTATQWEPVTASTGSVQNVAAGAGLLGGPITQNGTLSVDVGTAANKILQLNGSAQIPAVDGSLLTVVNAVKLQTRSVAATAPTAGQVLAWNTSLSQWEPTLATAGSVTYIQTANGILGGPVTSTGTISIDTGTTAGQILQLNGGAQIPAVDAALLFNVNASKIATRSVASTAPTVGQVLGWNVTSTQWEPVTASTGSVQNVAAGLGLLGGPITQNGTLSVDVGTAANKILQLNGSAQIPAVDGSLLAGVNAVKLQTRSVAATAPTAGQVLAWNTSLSQWEPTLATAGSVTNIQTANGILGGPITSTGTISVDTGTIANKILQLNGSAQIPAVDGSLLVNVNASKIATRTVASTAPIVGQVLGWNVAATQWEPVTAATGSVQSVVSGLGLLGGPITQNGTLSVDVGTAANQILQLNGSAQIPALDGGLLTSINAVRLQTRAIATTAPTAGQVLAWNTSLAQWEPTLATAGSVTNIQTANGMLGGPITSTGTISVDTGTVANKILQLNGAAQIPAVDAALLFNVNASKISTYAVASTAPTLGQVLGWNVSSTQWEPVTAATGSVQNVFAGIGLLGGPITQNGTLSVDVGTAANKILQLNGTAQIPAVDGALLTSVNAVKLQTRSVAATAPTAGQVLAWNTSLSQWEPTLATAGSVTNIQTANGILGGPITSTGTISVDTGTGAGKILQLNASAQIPAVDGALLSNVNAAKLATRAVALTAPGVGQVLGWNVTATQWEPVTASTGSVQNVASGVGLLGGPITQNGTLSVDVGTAANKILQLNGSAQLPAVDGSLLTALNAVKLQTRSVAATAPTSGQVLAWNTSLAQWEPTLATAGSVTNIQTANGILGGPITSTGTISVDTGTVANKILQLNGAAQIPAVDGSLLINVNAVKIATRTVASTAPTLGQVLGWNVTATQWEPVTAATGSVQNVSSGVGLLGGPITQNGTLAVDVGTAANKILQLNGTAQIPAVDGSLITNVNAVSIQTRAVAATAPTAGQVLAWNTSLAQWEPTIATAGSITNIQTANGILGGPITSTGTISIDTGTIANKILQLNGAAQIPAVDGSLLMNVNAAKIATRTVATTAPTTGQVLGWNVTATQWEPVTASTGSVQNVASGVGLLGGPITQNGTLSVDVGTAANKILQLNGSAQLPAVDGSLLTAVNAVKLQTRTVASTAPTVGQVLGWNVTATQWEPVTASTGSVQNVSSGLGLLGGPITQNGTLSVDVGTAANKILQLNASAQLPAVDGSLLTALNAVKLQARPVAATAPTAGQVLAWNTSLSQWEPTLATAGSVTNVQTANGLLGGPITSTGTISVDTGTVANKILQLNGAAQIPAVDASLLLNVNASKIATRSVASTAPTSGQVLGWNVTLTQWEPVTAATGSVQNVASGLGLLGGPITQNGTLSVDVGTAANKILQLNGSAQVPAVDGSLLMAVNAVKLQTRLVAATAPTAGQVLAWNTSLSQWEPTLANSGSVTNIQTANGLLGGPITATGTISVDTGTIANKILQLNGSAQIPAVDGSLLFSVNAAKIATRSVASTAPTVGQVLGWNVTSTQWEPVTAATGSVQVVASGVGLLGGPITQNGTLSVDVGTAANKILQLNGSAQLPAVDASLLTMVNAIKLQTRAVAATAPTAGQVLGWNTSLVQWEPTQASSGSVTNIQTANGILGGPITSTGTISIDTGTTAGKILQLNGSAQVPAIDGSLIFNVNAAKIATRTVAATLPTVGQVLGWNVSATQWEPVTTATGSVQSVAAGGGLLGGPITQNGTLSVDVGTAANKILQLNASAQIPAVDASLLLAVNAVKLQTRAIAATAPTAGQVLAWNTVLTQWEPTQASAGSVTNIQTANGILGGPITSSGTLSVDTGTVANKILQLNGSAMIPAVDASLLFNVNASKIATRTVASTAPTVGQVLGWNVVSTQWEPTSSATGSVQNVSAGAGLLGGPITQSGTLSVDVGTAANKILQLNGSAQIPAVDGSLIAAVNAAKIATRTVATTAPTSGQVLGWNVTSTQWEPVSTATGSVQMVSSGTGLTGGPITQNGTLSVDVGTAAGKILQLNGSAQIPAVDAALIFNVNASKLATRVVATTLPAAGQVLGWNVSTTQWEPVSTSTGSVQSVNSGVGLIGGPITANGTLSVDVGTAASKILQLTAGAQIPGVDGSLLTGVNAVKLQTRGVSAVAPTAGQVLAWNQTSLQWEPSLAAAGTISNLQTANGILGGPITSTGTISVDTGTSSNKILQLNATAQIPAVDAALLLNVDAAKIASRSVASTLPTAGQVLGWNVSATRWEPVTTPTGSVQTVNSGVGLLGGPITSNGTLNVDVGTAAAKILQLNASAQIPAVDGSLVTGVNAVKLQTRALSATAPSSGQVLSWNSSVSQWEPQTAATGSVSSVQTANGLLGGPITSTGTLSVDSGTAANKILQLNASAQIPAVDGSLLLNVSAAKLGTRTVAVTSPTAGQVLGWNVTTTQWEPTTASTGSVQSVSSGTGLLGGPITSNGTLTVDVGTVASKILQLNVSAQIPAVDASLLFNVNASKIGTRAISTAAPSANQHLGWNATTTQWEPVAAATGSVQSVSSGTGLLGGPITSNGTLTVDVGTVASKILQLNVSAQIPAVDASLLFNVNASKLATRTVALTAPVAGQVLGWNVTTTQWEPTTASTGSVQSVSSGTGLLGGPITANGTLTVDVGTIASKILQLNASAQIPAVDASLLFNVNASKIASRTVSSTLPVTGQVLGWNVSTTQWEPTTASTGSVQSVSGGTGLLGGPITTNGTLTVDVGTIASKILQLNASAQIPAVDGSLLFNVNASKIATRTVALTAPVTGQVLGWNVVTTQWEPTTASTGSVQSVSSGTGLLGGPITSNGTLTVDVGTIASKILQLNASAQIPAVDASLLFNVNASKIGTRTITTTAPAANQHLGWNATTTQWEPVTAATGSVQSVSGGTGLLGGPITTNGTLTVDVGTIASKILQLNASAQVPAVDGSLLFSVNASKLATRAVALTAPVAGQVLGWNVSTTQWEPTTASTGSVQSVSGGTGLLGGPITTNGTLTVDVGTIASKILQLNASAQIPAVDGSLLFNVNASKIGTRTITTTAPAANQHLGWNATTTQWEPVTAATGSVQSVASGTGLLGGPITTNGTLTVDVGTIASKILQLNASAQIPAVDASLLFNVNASKIGTRTITTTAPTANQHLGWNASTTQWEPVTPATGSVQSVVGGTGFVTGTITTNGTLNIDVGATASKIVQENANAQIMQNIGSLSLPSYGFVGDPNTGLYSPGTDQLTLASNGVAALSIIANANVGVGIAIPTTKFQVAGVISPSVDNTYTLGSATLRFSTIYASSGLVNTSDARQKKDIKPSDLGLDFLLKLRPVSYHWKTGADVNEHYGLIAQDTERVIAEVKAEQNASSPDQGIVDHDLASDRYGIRYTELISPIIKAFQELHQILLGTQERLRAVESDNARLTREVTALKEEATAREMKLRDLDVEHNRTRLRLDAIEKKLSGH